MPSRKLLEQVRERLRVKHYSLRTEDAYLHWMRRFIYFHGKKHPREMGGCEVEAFVSHRATEGRVSASTQNQALSALLVLYREVLEMELPWMDGMVTHARHCVPPDARRGVQMGCRQSRPMSANLRRSQRIAALFRSGKEKHGR